MGIEPGEINALLGHGTDFTGKLTFEGTVRIDGRFHGEVFTSDVLIIGEGAEVRAEIDVGTLIVKGGVVVGNIRARDLVEIHSPGQVLGNIVSPSLYIGKGVVFDGRCTMRQEGAAEDAAGAADEAAAGGMLQALPQDLPAPEAARVYPAAPPSPGPLPAAAVPPGPAPWPPVQVVPPVPVRRTR